MILQVTDGTTTVQLSGAAPIVGCTYFPGTPQRTNGQYADVTETAEVVLRGTAAQIRTAVNSLETLFEQAARRAAGALQARVYVQYTPVDADAVWRSEVLEGRVTWSSDPGLRRLGETTPTVKVAVFWRRRFYWEGAEAELQLSTSNQAAATGGRTIKNHDDSGAGDDNWVQIAANQVTGVLPAGVRIQLQNTTGAARTWRKLYVALNALSSPANFVHILEAEARLTGGTVQNDAAASNGQKLQFTVSASSVIFTWTLSAALLQYAAGRLFRLLATVNGVSGATPTGTAVAEIRDANASVALWRSDGVALPTAVGILDLGTLPLPPGGYQTSAGALNLTVMFTGTGTWTLDFLQLTPTDGLTLLACAAAVANSSSVVVDSIEDLRYVLTGSAQYPYVAQSGGEILLLPNTLQRLIVLAESGEAGPAIADTFVVRVWHRPRRVTV